MLAVWGSVAEDSLDVPGVVGGDDFFGYDLLRGETVWFVRRMYWEIRGSGSLGENHGSY